MVGSVIVYNPSILDGKKKRVSVFDVGVVTNIAMNYNIVRTDIDFVYLIEVQTSQAKSHILYHMTTNKITINQIELRYLFRYNPIINDVINLSNDEFREITCAFFNGKQID